MKSLKFATLFLFVFACFTGALADGIILPIEPHHHKFHIIHTPPPTPAQNFTVPLSVEKHHVKVSIDNLAATTAVDQIFHNHENRTIEGLYIFPLPYQASISGFAMDIEGEMKKGELLDAKKAKKIYEDIVRQMKDPGLLEYLGKGIFKTRIYPINARSDKRVKLNYQEALKMEGNLIRYVYPLDIDKYTHEDMKDVAIEVKIKSKIPITSVYSPTHKVSVHKKNDNEATVGFEVDKLKPEKDFILYYAVSKKDLSLSFLSHRPDPSEDGTFMMMLAPRMKAQEKRKPAIDVALVMDTSGSMSGKKITQARKALKFCINSLKTGSNFYLANFSTEAESYKNSITPVNEDTRTGALEYIKNLDAMGGTNISEAFEKSIKALKKSDTTNPKFIVFVTDGKPTAGLTESEEIIKLVKKLNKLGIRIFTFGIGNNLNATLIDNLASENGGVSDYVSENEDMEIKISSLFSKLTHPVMTNIEIEFHNVSVKQIYPRKISDVFKDSNILILGKYSSPGEGRVTLSGNLNDQKVKIDFEASFPRHQTNNGFVGKIWATRKIGYLLEQIRKNGDDPELRDEIVKLAKRYAILTPYTSFLVIEDKAKHGPDLRTQLAPRHGIAHDEFEEAKSRFSVKKLESLSEGADAIGASREMNALKMAGAPAQENYASLPHSTRTVFKKLVSKDVHGKTFYLINSKWVDSLVKEQKADIKIKAYSEAYFELLKLHPQIGKYASIGENIIIKFNKKIIELSSDSGVESKSQLQF